MVELRRPQPRRDRRVPRRLATRARTSSPSPPSLPRRAVRDLPGRVGHARCPPRRCPTSGSAPAAEQPPVDPAGAATTRWLRGAGVDAAPSPGEDDGMLAHDDPRRPGHPPEEVPDPADDAPTDAIVRVVAAASAAPTCGPTAGTTRSGRPTSATSRSASSRRSGWRCASFAAGDFVITPFCDSDITCLNCRDGLTSACANQGWTVSGQADRQGPPGRGHSRGDRRGPRRRSPCPLLLTLADVMATGWHAAVSAGVRPGSTAVVIGDGAVGLCGVIAAKELGAERIVAMSRHESRQQLATDFGATDIVEERGDAGVEAILEMTDGIGATRSLECVGTDQSMGTAFHIARPGSHRRFRRRPARCRAAGASDVRPQRRAGRRDGARPRYLPDLLAAGPRRPHRPGPGLRPDLPLDEVAEGYRAMDERRAIKVMLRPEPRTRPTPHAPPRTRRPSMPNHPRDPEDASMTRARLIDRAVPSAPRASSSCCTGGRPAGSHPVSPPSCPSCGWCPSRARSRAGAGRGGRAAAAQLPPRLGRRTHAGRRRRLGAGRSAGASRADSRSASSATRSEDGPPCSPGAAGGAQRGRPRPWVYPADPGSRSTWPAGGS